MTTLKKFERLPSNVKPVLYDLTLRVDLKTFKFFGKETIHIEIAQVVDKIILNSKELSVTHVTLIVDKSKNDVQIPETKLLEEDDLLTLQFPNKIPVGKAELVIEFNGVLSDKMVGFYRSKYIKVAGEKEDYFAVTQFEATDARRCFPCWDEPALKACFDVTLEFDSTKIALSNMPVESESQIEDSIKQVKFARTPRMSTYLLAFVIGDFDYVEDKSSDGILVRVYTPPGKKEQGKFALYAATKVLPYYKEYFQIAYPLPKMDLVAISEMSCGAMENWGLVTYRETFLLVDEKNSSAATKQDVAIVVGHELAHQWFGNLVTMEWWTHLWLNEGYASFVEFLCVDYLFPDYDIWTQFATDYYCRALKLDALKNSHPIEVPVGHPSEVDEIFDEISYGKGASVIRMLHKYIGENDFRKGMNLYLTRHQYSNTFTEDLWAALEEVSKKPIKAVMSTWTKQVGFPIITVESSVQENTSRTLVLSQSKFCVESSEINEDALWLIPISFSSQSKPDKECFCTMMETRQCTITIPNVAAEDWIKLNQGTVGFYRTKYDPTTLQQFVPSIENKSLPPLDRLGILDDLFALVQIGRASTAQALDLIWAMKNEDNYTVWANISTCLEKIHSLLMNTDCVDQFEAYGIRVMKPIYDRLGYENDPKDPHLTTLLRNLVLNRLIRFGATDLTDIFREKFEKHCSGVSIIPADQRSFVYRSVIATDGKKAFNELIKLYRETDLQEEKDRILRAFSSVVDEDLVEEILRFTESTDLNPPSVVTALISIAVSKVGRIKTYNFFRDRYEKFYTEYAGGFLLGKLIKFTTENFASEEEANEIEAFFANKNTSGAERTVQQSLETIRNNAAWLRKDGELIKQYLCNLKL